MRQLARAVVVAGSLGAVALAAHTFVNLRSLRRPDKAAPPTERTVAVLVPARNESAHIQRTAASVLAQEGVPNLSLTILDDGSTDGTAQLARDVAEGDPRARVISAPDEPVPPGWLGKPWACTRLAETSEAEVLCFVDADVSLSPDAIRACVDLMTANGFSMVAPYPRQLADSWFERLVQPLVTWSWAATMPLGWAERSARPSLSAANGQLLVMERHAYESIGGHFAVRGKVLEDIELMRAFKRAGFRTVTVDGSQIAACRMYDGGSAVVNGYGKSLWSAFGGPAGSLAVCSMFVVVYVAPVMAIAARGPRLRVLGLVGYLAGVTSRALVARRTGEPLADSLWQPVSIAAFVGLNVISWRRHLSGENTWKGRPVVPMVQT